MEIKVTQAHINAGKRSSPCECPVSLALKDAGVREPMVTGWGIQSGHPARIRVPLPPSVWSFAVCFDDGQDVEPFEFEISDDLKEPAA